MSMGSWFNTHRKQVVTHTSIAVAFLLFTILLSEPLFDRLERIPGEAQLHRLQLPAETGGIQYWIDQCGAVAQGLEISGWAFIKGHDSLDSETYIVLESADRSYVFTTETVMSEGVTEHFQELGLNLDYSGFAALIPARKVAEGEYTIGIYIAKGDIEALQYTARAVDF